MLGLFALVVGVGSSEDDGAPWESLPLRHPGIGLWEVGRQRISSSPPKHHHYPGQPSWQNDLLSLRWLRYKILKIFLKIQEQCNAPGVAWKLRWPVVGSCFITSSNLSNARRLTAHCIEVHWGLGRWCSISQRESWARAKKKAGTTSWLPSGAMRILITQIYKASDIPDTTKKLSNKSLLQRLNLPPGGETVNLSNAAMLVYRIKIACVIFCIFHQIDCKILFSACMMLPQSWPQPTMNEGFKLHFKICLTLQWTLKLTITTSVFIEERWRPIEHNLQCWKKTPLSATTQGPGGHTIISWSDAIDLRYTRQPKVHKIFSIMEQLLGNWESGLNPLWNW